MACAARVTDDTGRDAYMAVVPLLAISKAGWTSRTQEGRQHSGTAVSQLCTKPGGLGIGDQQEWKLAVKITLAFCSLCFHFIPMLTVF